MRKTLASLLMIILCAILAGCQSSFGLQTTDDSSVKIPTLEIPTPAPDRGVVVGSIFEKDTSNPVEAALFLSKNLTADHPGYPPLISFSYDSNPRAFQDDFGQFRFQDIPAGQYVLVLWTPAGTEFYKAEGSEDPMLFNVTANQVLDLGELHYP